MTDRPKRERPELVELNLLIQKFQAERDPERAKELAEEIERMKERISKAHSSE
jgi:hypothetical protein